MVTIDGESARDFDDGVYVEKKPGGAFTLYVAIADVSHYVTPVHPGPGGRAARQQRLLPQRAVHMLPEQLATDVCTLKPDVDRLAVVVILDYDRTAGANASSLPGPSSATTPASPTSWCIGC